MAEELRQGPRAGVKWPAEVDSYTDPNTGARVRRLTDHPGADDHHLYFTTDGWYDDGRRLLLRSRREGRRNLFSLDLETGVLTQVTDLPEQVYGSTRVDPGRREVYVTHGDRAVAVDLDRLSVREVARCPPDYRDDYAFAVDDVLADGDRLLVKATERTDVEGFDATRERRPHCAVFVVPVDGSGDPELVHEEERWISHVNASPTRPELLTYCHEGPWDRVDNRMHVANLDTGETYRLRAVDDDEAVGHEFWLADGEHVGYHGWRGSREDGERFFGTVRYDDTDRRETPIPVRETHCHANGRSRFVCDGDTGLQHLLLYDADGDGGYRGPRKLATHAWDEASPHPHSRFSPDGSTVVFDADPGGDSDVYLVDVPAFDDLPRVDPDGE